MDKMHFPDVCSPLFHFYSGVIRLYRASPARYCGYGNVSTALMDAESHGSSRVVFGTSDIFDRMAGGYKEEVLGKKVACLCSLQFYCRNRMDGGKRFFCRDYWRSIGKRRQTGEAVALDAAAILIPGIPAGLSKVDDAVKFSKNSDEFAGAGKTFLEVVEKNI